MTEPTPRVPKVSAAEETAAVREVLGIFASDPNNHVVRTFAQHPALANLFLTYNRHLLRTSTLDPRLRQIAIMRVTWTHHATYMWSSHLRMSLRIGMTGADFEAAKQGVDSPHWSPLERLIVRAADECKADSVLSDATWNALAAQLDHRQIMDLLFTIGTYGLVAFVINSIRIDREAELQALALQYGAPTPAAVLSQSGNLLETRMQTNTDLEAYIAISQVKARYCRTLDTKDWAGYADVFTEDYELDISGAGGPAQPIRGRDAVVRMVRASVETAHTSHQVHSPEIRVEGDIAHVVWAMQDRVVWGPDRKLEPGLLGHTGYGHYHERYVRGSDGRWRIASVRLTRLHVDNHYAKTG